MVSIICSALPQLWSSRKAWLLTMTLGILFSFSFPFPPKTRGKKKKRRMKNKNNDHKSCLSAWSSFMISYILCVNENSIGAPKMHNNYSIINFSNTAIAILDLSLLLLVKLLPFIFLLYFIFQSYRSSNYRHSNSCRSFMLLKAIAKCYPLLFAIAFKSIKERQLLLSL